MSEHNSQLKSNDISQIISESNYDSDDISNNSNVFISSSSNSNNSTYSNKSHNKVHNGSKSDEFLYENDAGNANKKNATNGIHIQSDVYSNELPDFIDSDRTPPIKKSKTDSNKKKSFTSSTDSNSDSNSYSDTNKMTKAPVCKLIAVHNEDNLVEEMLEAEKTNDAINGWNTEAIETIKIWYKIFKQQSWVYQFILDRNLKISDRLGIISICMNALLGIFCAFKLWIDDNIFQIVSNIILIFSNLFVGLLTAISKRYIDDKRNEEIRAYIGEVDIFFGEISAQVLKHPKYRMNADEFFKTNNDKYTKLVSNAPNLSIFEITQGNKMFKKYNQHRDLDKHMLDKESNDSNV